MHYGNSKSRLSSFGQKVRRGRLQLRLLVVSFSCLLKIHDSNASVSNEILNNSAKLGRATKILAAASALVIGAVIHGVISLERMVAVFRLLIGNCKTVCDGLVVDLMGEPSIVALSRMQRTLPLNLVFPPAYSIFSFVVWRPFILNANITNREDIHQLYQSLTMAISDATKHLPFLDVCMRDTHGFYDLVAVDASDSEFAAMLELNGPDLHLRAMTFVHLRARLFLNAIIDCKMPNTLFTQDDVNWVSEHAESKVPYAENETKLLDKLVHILDTLQPAKFHWQWVELRLLLNEQALLKNSTTMMCP
ncbi:Mediator of RNA polymerase II transcription subunit 12 [Vitis vinifera]|uniref:Mediator of RNA polymerase II transcription subunit 12 n=1 Tax=Vitis vinifera TaxID=29760 RepID=A0A438GSP6_VITVI|nr:Mediator of RNA polymerase II transcription subunit 12 [Vitis vinifera]